MVPFKELGLGLSEEQISEEEAHNLTDGFSLPALKVFYLWTGRDGEKTDVVGLFLCSLNVRGTPCAFCCLLDTVTIIALLMFLKLPLKMESIIKIR